MSEGTENGQATIHTIIFHASEARILLLPGEEGWSLPVFLFHGGVPIFGASQLCQEVQRRLGLSTTTLRCVYTNKSIWEDKRDVERIYALENHTPAWEPPAGALWAGVQELNEVRLQHEEQRTSITDYLKEVAEEREPALRPPWARRGWFPQATAWLQRQLAEIGYAVSGPVEQVQNWDISYVLRVPTTRGNVYFKASLLSTEAQLEAQKAGGGQVLPLLFANEPALTQTLAELYPQQVPTVLAAEREKGWMVTADFAAGQERQNVWPEIVSQYAELQRASIEHRERLLAAGCLDRRLDKLESYLDELVGDSAYLSGDGLSQDEIEQLRQQIPYLKRLCRQLAGYKIPETLVHGDLHGANLTALPGGGYIFFDWTDACIAHPFFDLITMPKQVEEQGSTRPLSEYYLKHWTDYEPIERLREAWAIAGILAQAHQIISYQHIIANLDRAGKGGLAGGLPYWARQLIQSLSERKEDNDDSRAGSETEHHGEQA